MIIISKVVLVIIEYFIFATVEEPVKDGKQQRHHDRIQYNQLDLYACDQGIKQYIQMIQ